MPFDVVFVFANDQQCVLLEQPKPQGVGDADLFRNRFLARASRPVEQIVPGFVLYQRYSPFFLIRHAPQIFLLCVVAAVLGIPLSYFLLGKER